MPAATSTRMTVTRPGDRIVHPLEAAATIYAGTMVGRGAGGFAIPGGPDAAAILGMATADASNPGANGDASVEVDRKVVPRFDNSAAADEITRADIGNDCYAVDDQTVAKTDGSETRPVAGRIVDVDDDGVWIQFR